MARITQPLDIFIARRQELLTSNESRADEVSASLPPIEPSITQNITSQRAVDLKFGLRVTRTEGTGYPSGFSVSLMRSESPPVPAAIPATPSMKHYRIFPDWQTSFFWKDPKYFESPGEDSVVDDEDIEAQYPALAPFFFDWRDVYETQFEKQEIHLGSRENVFRDAEECVAWCVEGFLMACWLLLQEEVESVEYRPYDKAYELRKEKVNDALRVFLEDMVTLRDENSGF